MEANAHRFFIDGYNLFYGLLAEHPSRALLQIVGGDKLIIPLLMELHMNPFKGRHFQRDIILWATVRWYCKYGISYRELQEMAERGVNVDLLHDLPLGSALCA